MFERWSSPESVFKILAELSRNQPCDFSGIRDYKMIDEAGGIQWPLPDTSKTASNDQSPGDQSVEIAQERRLFEDGAFFHPDHKAKFLFKAPRDPPELPDAEYPFLLLTGRGTSSQWHTQTRTGKSAVLRKLNPEEIYLEMNPADAEELSIAANEKVFVTSRRGKVTATAFITNTVQRGQVSSRCITLPQTRSPFRPSIPIRANQHTKLARFQCGLPPDFRDNANQLSFTATRALRATAPPVPQRRR